MYVPEELKLNKLRKVSISRPKDYFLQYGFRPISVYSGDNLAPIGERKIDKIHALDDLDRQAAFDELSAAAQQEPATPAPAADSAPQTSNDS